jgi:general secretion pathway protein D
MTSFIEATATGIKKGRLMSRKRLIASLLCLLTAHAGLPFVAVAQPATGLFDNGASLNAPLNLPGGNKRVSLTTFSENVRLVLHNLAKQGGFNLVMDDSVSGNVSISLNNVTINQAMQAVATMADVQIMPQAGNIYLAISNQASQDKGVNRSLSRVIKLHYASANRIATLLNKSLFAPPGAGGGNSTGSSTTTLMKVKGDPRTNSIIVVGTPRDLELAEAAVARLDAPRLRKTFYLSHGNALDVATMLVGSVFNDGTSPMTIGNSGNASSSSGSAGQQSGLTTSMPTSLRVEKQDIQEGSGINNFGGSSSGGGGGGGGGQGTITSGLSSSVTLRGFVKSNDMLQISPEGPLVVPDSRQNAVTIFGTAEQIAQAEALIPTLDARLPQVSIEASLSEITESGVRDLGTRFGVSQGNGAGGFNNLSQPTAVGGGGLVGMPTVDPADTNSFARSGAVFSTNPVTRSSDYLVQLRALISNRKAKVLANPTVVATHDTESLISIVDEVIRRVTVQVSGNGFATQTVEVGEAGIVLDILPKIGEDGTVNMRLRPSVTSVLTQTTDALGNIITLLSKRDLLTQNVRLVDGQTLVVGGLIQQSDNNRQDKLPGLGDLPVVGAMFRASARNGKRSEIVMLITPHILNKTLPTPTISSTTPTTVEVPGDSIPIGGGP